MFDDLNKNSTPTGGGQPPVLGDGAPSPFAPTFSNQSQGKVEDLFAETDKVVPGQGVVKPAVFQPKPPSPPGNGAIGMDDRAASSGGQTKKIILLAVIVLASIILIGGGIYAFTVFKNQAPVASVEEEKNTDEPAVAEDENSLAGDNGEVKDAPENNNQPTSDQSAVIGEDPAPAPIAQKVDTDGDGISDEEEESLGMNINNPDSDGDGLFDREEVKVYKTDPLQIDTDGDGYSDGEEVKNGFNPKGSGKLFEIK